MGSTQASMLGLLKILMILICAGWVSLWLLKPTDLWTKQWKVAENHARNTFIGYYGLNFAVFTFPIIAVAILGLIYLNFQFKVARIRHTTAPATALSNPLIVNGLIGILSGAEILAAVLFVLFLAWSFYARISKDFKNLVPIKSLKLDLWQLKYMRIATRFGLLAEGCLVLLLFPILRVIPLFRLLGIQFEASVRYHIWLGTAMIFFATFHGMSTLFIWGVSHHIQDEIWRWQKNNRIYLAGEIALVVALVIWALSLPVIRRRRFEIFYYTHHLYVVFLLFFLFHAGDRHFYAVFPGIFLFGLDKLLRIIQSRPESCILSAKLLPCGAVELTLPKDSKLEYSPTSIIFVKIPTISKLQWHAFSITSSSSVDNETISIIAKCDGSWTNALYQEIQGVHNSDLTQTKCIPISVEGPYGPPSVDFLRYDSLLLIGGGIGVTPFLSIIQEIASPRNSTKNRFPQRIQLVFAVKKSEYICLLNSISDLLRNQKPEKLHLKLKVYVTQEHQYAATPRTLLQDCLSQGETIHFYPKPTSYAIHGLWSLLETGALVGFATVLFLVFLVCFNHAFVPKQEKMLIKLKQMVMKDKGGEAKDSKQKTASSMIDVILLMSFILSIVGSSVVAMVLRWRKLKREIPPISPKKGIDIEQRLIGSSDLLEHEIHFQGRPDFQEILSKFPGETGGSDMGVLVCGPETMKESVATICQKMCLSSGGGGGMRKPKLSFHLLNFTL